MPYYPQAAGLVERMNGLLKGALKKLNGSDKDFGQWRDNLSAALQTLNNRPITDSMTPLMRMLTPNLTIRRTDIVNTVIYWKTHEEARIPERATPEAAGLDLGSVETQCLLLLSGLLGVVWWDVAVAVTPGIPVEMSNETVMYHGWKKSIFPRTQDNFTCPANQICRVANVSNKGAILWLGPPAGKGYGGPVGGHGHRSIYMTYEENQWLIVSLEVNMSCCNLTHEWVHQNVTERLLQSKNCTPVISGTYINVSTTGMGALSCRNASEITNRTYYIFQGGAFYFLEHVTADPTSWYYFFQKILDPTWKYIGDGCKLTKETWKFLENAGFSEVKLRHIIAPFKWSPPSKAPVRL
ncbi:uncharacterized protein LOC128473810 [Spea bombifrons]|uniref:uncharacterized protein LOC128473810 n=1 Tax=Spea bombifrons TaxID=233779 RepID=UPI00234A2D91|nr:uncharacterized protein LOC128473810 [Spea bombifrons]